MNPFLSFIIRFSIAIPAAFIGWLVSYFGFDLTFLVSLLIAIGGAVSIAYITKMVQNHLYLKKQKLSRKEYKYIKKNLDEAKIKLARLNKALISIRHLHSIKQRKDLLVITRKIHSITKKEPRRFYQAEKFYFSHLESLVELTEKYAFLSRQPKKTKDLEQSLIETRQAIGNFANTIEMDLHQIIAGDVEQLNFELDVLKHIQTKKELPFPKEGRKK